MPRVKPALGTRGGTATFPTKAPAHAPRYILSKTFSIQRMAATPEPRTTVCKFLRWRVDGHIFFGRAIAKRETHAQKAAAAAGPSPRDPYRHALAMCGRP